MTENYVDPNSGAAAQPGGFSGPPAVSQEEEMTDIGADTSTLSSSDQPAGNAKRDDWADFARGKGAPDEELVAPEEGGLTRDELRDKYGIA
jgi:hypothetical protein